MKKTLVGLVILALVAGAVFLVRGGSTPETGAANAAGGPIVADIALPADLTELQARGKSAFDAICADCHGANGAGVDGAGPPLVHKIYEPSHHGDMSFLVAVRRGVRAHHWDFGDMPAVGGLSDGDVAAIVAYIRRVQRENGIE
ncbi:c-type cytochrome [Oceanomicrobium pacificus]|uniref:C-type cytochrome n=1 Tax=Oceanomicrobium pacificus TaxID=2692916 RepID=A0A6B0TS19_9RHOB|nr:cytochrome c [Oceanomicrobium pacificus]MXU64528.1 c-type cytochrome [Oceanomicrobium pacificus]